jgi:hypothetical protein
MKTYKIAISFLLLSTLISCGGKNESEKSDKKETNITQASKITKDTLTVETSKDTTNVNLINKNYNVSKDNSNKTKDLSKSNVDKKKDEIIISSTAKKVDVLINSPLRNLLNEAQIGKSYTKKELIEQYKFPKEAVDLVKQVTYVGPNKLYFKWGSTWLVEKVSDAEFENGTMIFNFKKNKTYVSGGAIGIKYNKKIYTDLILNNGVAYIPTVKGFHWDINKQ